MSDAANDDFPHLTEADIRAWVGDTSLQRGRPYARHGSVFNLRRHGRTLKAQCQGSQPTPYREVVEFDADGIAEADCSCPVGAGGHCKHVAAVLLAWLAAPAEFADVPDPDSLLVAYTQDELVALVRRMLERHPDLEKLLERHPPRATAARRSVTPESVRRQVAAAFRDMSDDYGAVASVAGDLLDLVDQGDEYAEAGEWDSALTVYDTVARKTLAQFSEVDDQDGDLFEPVQHCVEGLGRCLAATTDAAQREPILRALFDVYAWDIDYGGIDMGADAPDILQEQATPTEQRQVAAWAREQIRRHEGDDFIASWRAQAYGRLALALEEDTLDDESFLRLCREAGLLAELIERLLELGRVDEAASQARRATDYVLLDLARRFEARGHAALAEQLIRERAATSADARLHSWLRERMEARGDLDAALTLSLDLFWNMPSVQEYERLRRVAQPLGRWDSVRSDVLARLADKGQWRLVTGIYLAEGDVDQALETVENIRDYGGKATATSTHLQVAQAAEATRPDDAIRLYLRAAETHVAQRNRGSYAQAGAHLRHVRDLYRKWGQEGAWRSLIADLRQQYRQLRALQDEWNQLGL